MCIFDIWVFVYVIIYKDSDGYASKWICDLRDSHSILKLLKAVNSLVQHIKYSRIKKK